MVLSMKDNFILERSMVKELSNGMTALNLKESFMKTILVDMGNILGMMEEFIEESGKVI